MTPPQLDPDIVAVRLRLLRDLLDQLKEMRGIGAATLDAEPVTRAAVERFIQSIVDLAVDVNGHIAAAALGQAPPSGRASFEAAAQAGAIGPDLADRLGPAVGLRNFLVHRYADIDVDQVAAAVDHVLDDFDAYVKQVARFVTSRPLGR